MGRPAGSLNKSRQDVRDLMDRMQTAKRISYARCIERLFQIAMGDDKAVAVMAAKALLDRRFGLPRIDVSVVHQVEGAAEILLRLVQSDQHRKALAKVAEHRKQLDAVTVEPEGEPHVS